MKSMALLAGLLALAPSVLAAAPLPHPVFHDHGVVQRDRPLPVWGTAGPGVQVNVTLAGSTASAKADAEGHWRVTLPPLPAGGPHVLRVGDGREMWEVNDILVGDVYLCSGQSNMEMTVGRSLDSWNETNQANHPNIRYLGIDRAHSARPLADLGQAVSWKAATPQTVPDMSAACYYFARDLRQQVDVPIGLIAASWGGSAVEAWMRADELRKAGGFTGGLDILSLYDRDPAAGMARFASLWEAWWKTKAADAPWLAEPAPDDGFKPAPAALGVWESWGMPELLPYNGIMWMRTEVTLTKAQAKGPAMLILSALDETDVTWINGKPVGSQYDPGAGRRYAVAPGILKAGRNRITLSITDHWGEGGMRGPADSQALILADGTKVPLSNPWQYRPTPTGISGAPRAPWESVAGLGTLHNAMIAPLGPVALRAALWYQGESNTGRASAYQGLLAGMMAGWRAQFGADLPFLIVQLPEYGYPVTQPGESGWADLRAAQRATVTADKHAALVVGLGLGDWYDIHPANKQGIGKRLARAARVVALGEKITPSGPVPASATRDGDSVTVRFTDIDGTLSVLGNHRPGGFELCDVGPGTCRFVDASLSGDSIILPVGTGPAARLRYCWADSPICTLYDSARLPAGPFEIKVQ